ncbi:MAG TPA: hypothetical protein VFQ44_07140 [Streptosporangiaceae bacterium]|nr:hypothetical protein [Streptosporangiaceae bacterium]
MAGPRYGGRPVADRPAPDDGRGAGELILRVSIRIGGLRDAHRQAVKVVEGYREAVG